MLGKEKENFVELSNKAGSGIDKGSLPRWCNLPQIVLFEQFSTVVGPYKTTKSQSNSSPEIFYTVD